MSVVNVDQAENLKQFVHTLATDKHFKDSLVDAINAEVNIPVLNEATEEAIFSHLFDCIIGTMEGTADKLYAAAVAEQLEEGRRLVEEAKQRAEDNEKSK